MKNKFCKYINQNNNYGIEYIWIPAHIGIYGNEAVDKLAKTATINQPELVLFVPFSDYKQLYKDKAALNTRKLNEQQRIEKGKEYYENIQKYQKRTKKTVVFQKESV